MTLKENLRVRLVRDISPMPGVTIGKGTTGVVIATNDDGCIVAKVLLDMPFSLLHESDYVMFVFAEEMTERDVRPSAFAQVRPTWDVVEHPTGDGYALLNSEGTYFRDKDMGPTAKWNTRREAEISARWRNYPPSTVFDTCLRASENYLRQALRQKTDSTRLACVQLAQENLERAIAFASVRD